MAGSYNHVVVTEIDPEEFPDLAEADLGKLLDPERLCGMLECRSGDVAEAVEEMYGMIWWLAAKIESDGDAEGYYRPKAEMVEDARKNYKEGLRLSPGQVES